MMRMQTAAPARLHAHTPARPRALSLLLAVFLFTACANPVPPSGGPPDRTPPSVQRSVPAADSVNVPTGTRTIRLEFSEYVERSSLPRALSLTPAFEQRLAFDWDGRAVDIDLPAPLRDSTTYILTLDTNLRDAQGVALNAPLTIAFSTGARIDQGELRGRVVDAQTGAPAGQIDIYAYPLADSAAPVPRPLPERPAYRTQTGDDGTFAFDHLRVQHYFVAGVRDANRNRQPDGVEPFAAPPRRALLAQPETEEISVPWRLARLDTLAPSLQRVQPRSRERLHVLYDEPVQLLRRTPGAWVLRDSVAGADVPVTGIYVSPAAPREVVVRTAPMEPRRHRLVVPAATVADTLGTRAPSDTVRFAAAATTDTVRTRLRAFLPPSTAADTAAVGLLPDVAPGIRLSQPADSAVLQQAVTVTDSTGAARPAIAARTGDVTYRLRLDPPLAPGETVTVQAEVGPGAPSSRRYRRVTQRELGGLEGAVRVDTVALPSMQDRPSAVRVSARAPSDSLDAPVVVEILPVSTPVFAPVRRLRVRPDSTFVFDALPDGRFHFRAFLDRNGNGRWDPGRLVPYVPSEPIARTRRPTDSRPRWTNVLSEPLRLQAVGTAPSTPPDTTTAPPDPK